MSVKFSFSSNADEVAGAFVRRSASTLGLVHAVVVKNGARLEAEVKRNASGRPGPNAPTGNYRRSIRRQTTRSAKGSETTTASSAPQALRLELGFVGTDALGRSYNSRPLPHFGPALETVRPTFVAELEAVLAAGSD